MAKDPMRQHTVDADTTPVLLALCTADDCLTANLLNKIIPHVSQRRLPVQAPLLFHLEHSVLDAIQLILLQLQPLNDRRIFFNQLCRSKTRRDSRFLRVVLNLMGNRMDGSGAPAPEGQKS